MQTLTAFLNDYHITAASKIVDRNPNMDSDREMNHYLVTVRATVDGERRRMSVRFSMGLGLTREPDAADVLDCLASDAAGFENARSFGEWCDEYGYDTDSRKAYKTYKAVGKQSEKLESFLGTDAYNALLWETERA